MRVGFIGLGAMGLPMARHLAAAGHALHVWARRPEALAPLADLAPQVAASPAALAAACEAVISIVTADADVSGLVQGDSGLLLGARPGFVHVDMSTIGPDTARRLAAAYQAKGADFIDAPVSGGAQGAAAATLAIMVGGETAALERVRPLLACLGTRIVHVGASGAGQVAKACNQMVMVAAIEAVAEALHLAAAAGVDPARVQAALAGGSAASRVLEVMGERMVRRDFAAGVEARLHHKDFGIILRQAFALGVPLPLMAQVAQQLNALMGQGWGKADTAALLKVLEQTAGRSD
ncbi:MAG: NAD(P)-dependent oxidoreductase [Azovibrio sp.]|nr:NAD(P)-dependent oxidoreductase [Azovibrio sp.]